MPSNIWGRYEKEALLAREKKRKNKKGILNIFMQTSSSNLWKHANFMKLWIGETVSIFGSQITMFALPLIAALSLHASPISVGILSTAEYIPILLFGLVAGAVVDRLPHRPILIITDVGRALILVSIPVGAFLNFLSMTQLYIVAFLTGTLSIFFDVAYQAFLPDLVTDKQLVDGNSKLEVSRSIAQIAGPSLAGVLIQLVTAPMTIIVDALSFLASAFFLLFMRVPNTTQVKQEQKQGIWSDMLEGVKVVVSHPILRLIVGITGLSNLFMGTVIAEQILYMTRELKIAPVALGLILSAGGPSALLGSLLAGRLSSWLGIGRTIIFGGFLIGLGSLCIPLATPPLAFVLILLVLSQVLLGFGSPVYNITAISLLQAITPSRLLGRVDACARFVILGTLPLGSLIGGVLAESIGLRFTLLIAAVCMVLAFALFVISPIFSLRENPTIEEVVNSSTESVPVVAPELRPSFPLSLSMGASLNPSSLVIPPFFSLRERATVNETAYSTRTFVAIPEHELSLPGVTNAIPADIVATFKEGPALVILGESVSQEGRQSPENSSTQKRQAYYAWAW